MHVSPSEFIYELYEFISKFIYEEILQCTSLRAGNDYQSWADGKKGHYCCAWASGWCKLFLAKRSNTDWFQIFEIHCSIQPWLHQMIHYIIHNTKFTDRVLMNSFYEFISWYNFMVMNSTAWILLWIYIYIYDFWPIWFLTYDFRIFFMSWFHKGIHIMILCLISSSWSLIIMMLVNSYASCIWRI